MNIFNNASHIVTNEESWRKFRDWYKTCLGEAVGNLECEHLDKVLSNLFGYHALQVGVLAQENVLCASRISHLMVLEGDAIECIRDNSLRKHAIQGRAECLPIVSDSLDVVVLPHVLEFSPDPHQVLRELDRTLVPEGHVVIIGFNPWSIWIGWRLLFRWSRRPPPWSGHALSSTRIKDWLSLLGFQIIDFRRFFYRPPINNQKLLDRLYFVENIASRVWSASGGIYLIVAKKRVLTLKLIKPRWRPKRSIIPTGAIETQNRK